MKVQQVSVSPIVEDLSNGLSNHLICTCSFCGKSSKYPTLSREMCEKLSNKGDFFCHFCLRNNHFARSSRHTLILTFRGIIAWYYHTGYKKPLNSNKKLHMSQIEDFIQEHAKAGLIHPAFKYDDESFLWFVDFQKIGASRKQLPVRTVKQTVLSILASFNLWEVVPGVRMHKLAEKYIEAIDTFYAYRTRPSDKRILAPTFANCGFAETKECPFEKTREFTRENMVK